ncbi:MAG: hypothetical protein LBV78_13805, partial [Kitasatospora sp.]|nr:hypothetical protein [Kitasatospora sp.]
MGRIEDEIRAEAEGALEAMDGLDVRRMFSGWGFYSHGLLFAAAWKGEFRFRTRQRGHWVYEGVDRGLLDRTHETVPPGRVQAVRIVEPLLWRRWGSPRSWGSTPLKRSREPTGGAGSGGGWVRV